MEGVLCFKKAKGNAGVLSTSPRIEENPSKPWSPNKEIIIKKNNLISVVDRYSKISVMRLDFNHLKPMKNKILTT